MTTLTLDDTALDAVADCIRQLRQWAREAKQTADPESLDGARASGGGTAQGSATEGLYANIDGTQGGNRR